MGLPRTPDAQRRRRRGDPAGERASRGALHDCGREGAAVVRNVRGSPAPRTPGEDPSLIRTLTEPGRVIGWSAVVEPYHYRDTATAIEDTRLLVFERQWLERRAEEMPEFGVELMTRILWVLGNRLRETRIRLVASRYEKEALAIRALLEESASELSVTSPLHKLPIYLESRLTLSDAFQTLELLRTHGDPLEASLARMCLEILKNVRKELDIYRRLQQIYEAVSEAPEDATPEEVRGDAASNSASCSSTSITSLKARKTCRRDRAHFRHEPPRQSSGKHLAE